MNSYALVHTVGSERDLSGLTPEKQNHAKEMLAHLARDPLAMSSLIHGGEGNIRTCRTKEVGANIVLAEGMRGLIRSVVVLALWDPDQTD